MKAQISQLKTGNPMLAGSVLVLLVHLLLFPLMVDRGTNLILVCVNLFALFNGVRYSRVYSSQRTLMYITGYFLLFLLFFAIGNSPLMFAAFGILYAAIFRRPLLLGIFLILVLSISIITPYWIQSTILLSLLYAAILKVMRGKGERFHMLSFGVGFTLLLAVFLPLVYLVVQTSPQSLMVAFNDEAFRSALLTSFVTSTITTGIIILFGVPLAYGMARTDFAGKRLVESLIDLPIVVPHSVVGIAMFVFLGPRSPIGDFLYESFGFQVSGSYLGIIVCQVFVSSPFLVRNAMNAFRDHGPSLERVSRTLGDNPMQSFFRVSLPLASGSIFTGSILTWARAISEVGSLMIFAHHPYTVSVYNYDLFVQYGLDEAKPAAVLMVIICLWGFLVLRWFRGFTPGEVAARRPLATSDCNAKVCAP